MHPEKIYTRYVVIRVVTVHIHLLCHRLLLLQSIDLCRRLLLIQSLQLHRQQMVLLVQKMPAINFVTQRIVRSRYFNPVITDLDFAILHVAFVAVQLHIQLPPHPRSQLRPRQRHNPQPRLHPLHRFHPHVMHRSLRVLDA